MGAIKMVTKKSMVNTIFLNMYIVIFIIILIFGYFLISNKYNYFEDYIHNYQKEYINFRKAMIKDEIDIVISNINFKKEQLNKFKILKPEVVQKEILDWINKIRLRQNQYIVVNKYDGTILAHFKTHNIGKNMWDFTDKNGVKAVQEAIKAAKNIDGGYVNYIGSIRPSTGKPGVKIAYAKSIPEWEWTVLTGVYMDDIEILIAQKRKELKESIKYDITKIGSIFIFVVLILFILSKFLTNRLKSNFTILSSFFNKAATQSEQIVINQIHFFEFQDLAASVNKMTIERNKINEELNRHQSRLEELVRQRTESLEKSNQALRGSEERFRSVYQTAPLAFVVWDKNSHVTDWNKKAEEVFGWSKEEVVGYSFFDFIIREKDRIHIEDVVKNLMKGELLSYSINDNLTKQGETITCEWNNSILHDNYGNIIGAISLGLDITDRKQAEEEKRKVLEFAAEQSKHALIGQVAGKMAHDFNNILMGIMGNAQLGILNCDDEITKEKLERISEFSERGREITNNLLSFSKDQEPKQTYFKIEDKIDLVLKMFERELMGIKVSRNYKSGIPELLADPGMIQDVLVNLIQNSIHAMSKVEKPLLNIKVYSQNDKVYFEIEDNGCGIPEEHHESNFTPSFTLKGSNDKTGAYKTGIKGTGYGMSNVNKSIVEKHKGDISLESQIGEGTKITIALKIIKDQLSSDEKKEVMKSKIYEKRRVLLVEDESAIADVQYQILTQAPFHHIVSIAVNGQMAIDIFNRNKFDFVSLDYMLPGNINGMDVYKHIREKDKDILIMFISGNIEFLESIRELKSKDPNLEHLSKPVANLDYMNKVNELIGRSIK